MVVDSPGGLAVLLASWLLNSSLYQLICHSSAILSPIASKAQISHRMSSDIACWSSLWVLGLGFDWLLVAGVGGGWVWLWLLVNKCSKVCWEVPWEAAML